MYKFIEWRKTYLFFAAFFCLSVGITSCKKKVNPLGDNVYPSDYIMGSIVVDTFDLLTYTVEEDSVASKDPEFNLLGSYNDPTFGMVEASFYTQLTLSGFSPDFGDLASKKIDSAVIAFQYGGYYGSVNKSQLFEIYELTESLSADSTYTRKSIVNVNPQNLVPTLNNEGYIKPNPLKPTVVGTDTLSPQLRIPIDTVFARNMLVLAENSVNDKDFLENFKGFYVKVNNASMMPGEGAILYLASTKSASKLTVYYSDAQGPNKFDFIITSKAVDFNHIDVDYTGTKMSQLLTDSTLGKKEYYAQAFTTRAKIDFPSLNNLPKDVFIHNATLEIPLSYYPAGDLYPSEQVNVVANLFKGDKKKYTLSTVTYSMTKKAYIIDLRTYVQNVLKGDIQNYGLYVSPKRFNTSVERIIFNGSNTLNKKKPKLKIVYTKL